MKAMKAMKAMKTNIKPSFCAHCIDGPAHVQRTLSHIKSKPKTVWLCTPCDTAFRDMRESAREPRFSSSYSRVPAARAGAGAGDDAGGDSGNAMQKLQELFKS